jgi:hypothetical protein
MIMPAHLSEEYIPLKKQESRLVPWIGFAEGVYNSGLNVK